MNTKTQVIATKYLVRVGVTCFIFLPPYIIWWKENQMQKMGKGVEQDIARIRSKNKSLNDINRRYHPSDPSVRNPDQNNNLSNDMDFNIEMNDED